MTDKKQTFEEKIQRLEQIIRSMERGEVALEESLKLFQEGTALVSSCEEMLNNAEFQVKKVLTATDGSPIFEDFTDGGN